MTSVMRVRALSGLYTKPLSPSHRSLRRISGTNAPPSVKAWIDQITSAPPITEEDYISPQRAYQLLTTLPTREGPRALDFSSPTSSTSATAAEALRGRPLPLGHHLVYFQPASPFTQLGKDGSSTEYNAPEPYLRRMWAGGSFEWNADHPLVIGEKVRQVTRVDKVEVKKDMVFVWQEKKLYPGGAAGMINAESGMVGDTGASEDEDWAVREMRTHVFRTDAAVQAAMQGQTSGRRSAPNTTHPPPSSASSAPNPSQTLTFTYTPTSPLLFRYSALTYNAHKIHYDKDWTRTIEGHPDLVVHGPLSATLLVELAGHLAGRMGKVMRRFEYRATRSIYVDREVVLRADVVEEAEEEGKNPGEQGGMVLELSAEQGGVVGMKAKAWLV